MVASSLAAATVLMLALISSAAVATVFAWLEVAVALLFIWSEVPLRSSEEAFSVVTPLFTSRSIFSIPVTRRPMDSASAHAQYPV